MDERGQETFKDRSAVIQAEAPRLISVTATHPDNYADIFYELTHRHTLYRVDHKSSPSRQTDRSQTNTIEGVGIRHLSDTEHLHWVCNGWDPNTWLEGAIQIGTAASVEKSVFSHPMVAANTLSSETPEQRLKAEKAQFIASLSDMILSYDPSVSQCTIEYQDVTRRTLVINSEGRSIQQQSARAGIRVMVSLNINQQLYKAYLTQGYNDQSDHLFFSSEMELAKEVIGRAHRLPKAITVPSGPLSVIFAGGRGGIWLHEVLGHALEADTVNTHPMHQRMNTNIADTAITITDDPTMANGHGSFDFDDEGTPAQRTVLVDKGRLRQLLTDRHAAKRGDYRLTGNGRRQDYRHLPLPRMTNLCLEGGTASPSDLISSIKTGIYVDQIRGGRFFQDTDRFELDVAGGHLIEKGRLTYPVKRFILTGRCSELLQGIKGIATDVQPDTGTGQCKKHGQIVPISVYAPTVWIETLDALPSPTSPPDAP